MRFYGWIASLLLAWTPLLVSVVATPTAFAEDAASIVGDIRVIGLRRVDADVVLKQLKTKKGDQLDAAVVTEDIRQIFATNLFRDVVVTTLPNPDRPGQVVLVYEVAEKPSVRVINIEGRDDISEDDVRAVVDVKPGTILNLDQLAKNVSKIRELYIDKGFFLVEVSYQVTTTEKNEVEVSFVIVENQKVQVKKITFLGNKHVSDDDLKAVIGTREGNLLSFITSTGNYKEEIFMGDLYRLQSVYFDRGYIYMKALKPQVQISADRRGIFITIPIEEGQQFNVGKITYSGNLALKDEAGNVLVSPDQVRERVTVEDGEVFNRTKLFADLQRAADLYRDYGYAYANVTPNTKIDPDKRIVDIDLEVETGEKVYYERIEISGNTKTRDKVIRRELRIFEGELFSATGLEISKQLVTALGYFEKVDIITERGSAPNKMHVRVEIKEKATGTFQVGAGFSTVERFIATAQIAQQNFLGRGQSIQLQAQLSFGPFGRQIVSFNFIEPYFLDSLWSANVSLYATQQLFRDFQRARSGGSLGFGHPLDSLGRWRAFLTYTAEYVQVGNLGILTTSTPTRLIHQLNQKGIVSSLRADLQFDNRDNRLFPTKGQFHTWSVEFADEILGSNFNFVRLQMNNRLYYGLPFGIVAKANINLGYIFSRSATGVPISERYFLGGIFSLRGFFPRAVGPSVRIPTLAADPSSANSAFVVGGDKNLQMNFELEFPILEKAGIRGVVFADVGNAWNDDENFFYIGRDNKRVPDVFLIGSGAAIKPPLGLLYSVGWGVRWVSPIGPLRFEWGVPLTKLQRFDRDMLFEFTIGNFF